MAIRSLAPYSTILACGCLLATVSCSTGPKTLRGWSRQPINHGPITLAPQPVPKPVMANPAAPTLPTSSWETAPAPLDGPVVAAQQVSGTPLPLCEDEPSVAQQGRTVGFTFLFPVNSASLQLAPSVKADLIAAARDAQRITVIGRTDGSSYSAADEQVALRRALAGRAALVAAGIEPTRIAVEFASAADYAQPNATTTGRDANRRVEFVFNADRQLVSTQ